MKVRTHFKCPATKLLLILIWGDSVVRQVSCSPSFSFSGSAAGTLVTTTITAAASSGSSWSPFPSSSLLGIGAAGSFPLLLTLLCIKFQDTNSMSVPSQKLKKLNSLFKQGSSVGSGREMGGGRGRDRVGDKKKKKKKKRRKKKSKKGKGGNKRRKFLGSSNGSPYVKSKHGFFSGISSRMGSPGGSSGGSPFSSSSFSNRNRLQQTQPSLVRGKEARLKKKRGNKRKLERRGGHTNERHSDFVVSSPISLKDILLNENEEDALREKILAKIDELDPLMCLPKVLCGYSNRQRHKKHSSLHLATTSTTTTSRPSILGGNAIDEYLQLLQIVGPKASKKKKEQEEKEVGGDRGKKKKKKKKVVDNTANNNESEEDDAQNESGGSSESDESTESSKSKKNRKKSKKKPPGFHQNDVNDEDEDDSDEEEDEDDDDEDDPDDDDDDTFDDEHVKDVIKRERMKKLMWKSGEFSDENWWDNLEGSLPPIPLHGSYNPMRNDDASEESPGTITGWFSSMFSKFMPRMSWVGNGDHGKNDDDFKHDPFFTSFDGRSMSHGRSLGGSSSSSWKLPNIFSNYSSLLVSSNNSSSNSSRTNSSRRGFGRGLDLEKLFGVDDSSRQLDSFASIDPAEKFRMAVELGRRLASPSQCDYVYNACPLTYEEVLTIINAPLSQAIQTTLPSTPPPTPITRNSYNYTYAHPFVTVTTPIVIPLPQQQYLSYPHHHPYQYQQPQPQYILHSQPPVPQQLPTTQQTRIQYTQQTHQQHHPQQQHLTQQSSFSHLAQVAQTPIEDIMAEVAKKKPHKTTIQQELPSGEQMEINLLYANDKAKSGMVGRDDMERNNSSSQSQESRDSFDSSVEEEESETDNTGNRSPLPDNSDNPFNHKILPYTNYNFFPASDRYTVRRKNGVVVSTEKPTTTQMKSSKNNNKKKKKGANSGGGGGSMSTTGSGSSSSSGSGSTEELNPSTPEKSIATDILMRQQRPATIPYTSVKGNYAYQQMLQGTSSPPHHHHHQHHHRHSSSGEVESSDERKDDRSRNEYVREDDHGGKHGKKKKKKKKKKNRTEEEEEENESIDSSSGGSSSPSRRKHNPARIQLFSHPQPPHHQHYQMEKRRGELNVVENKKKRKHKPPHHLHKQSSESSEAADKRVGRRRAPNAIYPVYGHPYPPPYGSYYHPPTPTSPSLYSYIFGR